jgi:predicted SprT family Zn-dependent metalloprotease
MRGGRTNPLTELKRRMIANGESPDFKRAKAALKRGEPIPPPYREKSDTSIEGEPKKSRSYDQEPKPQSAITPIEYSGLQAAYDHFNKALFKDVLPDVFITYQRRAHSRGYFAPDRFSSRIGDHGRHELALNPDGFIGRTNEHILSTLVHEQCHVWQHAFLGHPIKRGYHDKEWAAQMKAIGLYPSNSGMAGVRETGHQMQHYVIPGGHFQQAYNQLIAAGWQLNLQSAMRGNNTKAPKNKTKFTCTTCGQNAWGKPDLNVICGACFSHSLIATLIDDTALNEFRMRAASASSQDILAEAAE